MRTRLAIQWAAAVLCIAGSCGTEASMPPEGARQSLRSVETEAEFGEQFLITAVRSHPRAWEAEPWPESLTPDLPVALLDQERTESATSVTETRRYALRAFSLLPEIVLELPAWSVLSGAGQETVVDAVTLRLRMRPVVDAEQPGDYELPEDLIEENPVWWKLALGASFLLAVLWLLTRRRRQGTLPEPVASPLAPSACLSATLEHLRADHHAGKLSDREFHERLGDWLRSFMAAKGLARTDAQTSEELLRAWQGLDGRGEQLDSLTRLFASCDAVKFARVRSEHADRERSLNEAGALVEEQA